jgi:hypothetical protein
VQGVASGCQKPDTFLVLQLPNSLPVGCGAKGEVSVSFTGATGPFFLLGDDAAVRLGQSLDVLIPEPASIVLIGMALVRQFDIAQSRM